MHLGQNPHQTATRFGCVSFSMYACGFSVPQTRQICFLTYPPRSSSEKMIFFLPKSASSLSRSHAHLAKWKGIGCSIGFYSWSNWTLYGVIPRSLYKIRLNDVSEMFNCWDRRWIDVDVASQTLSATAAIFSGVCTVFSFTRFGLPMRGCQFLSLFSQDNEHTVLLFCQNPVRNFRTHFATLPWFSK